MPAPEFSRAVTACGQALAESVHRLTLAGMLGDTVPAGGPELPDGLRARLSDLVRSPDPDLGYRVVPGLFAHLGDQGPTPTHWRDVDRTRTSGFDLALALVAAQLGEVFGWTHQQDGRLVHNILPSPGSEHLQIGASSTAPLVWHTEDAFHPERADLLLLACVRNPDGVGSSLSTINRAGLSEADVAQLVKPCVAILPDDSYTADPAEDREPVGVSTVWRRKGRLGLRYDPSYSTMLTEDVEFVDAYRRLGQALEDNRVTVPLRPGDLLIIDNDVTVHGRVAFRARYDGTDRWLKRMLVRAPRMRPAAEGREHGFGQVRVHAEGSPVR
jgi:L-asparagine oxygenase